MHQMSEEEKNVNFIFKRNILGMFTFDFFNTAALKMRFFNSELHNNF